MAAPRKYSEQVRRRALNLVTAERARDPSLSLNAAAQRIGAQVKIPAATLRKWVQVEGPAEQGVASGLVASAKSGSRVAALRDLRDLLAETIVRAESARDRASLSRQLMDVLVQIEAAEKLEPEAKGTPLDELEKRRAARQSGATRQPRAEGGVVAR